MLTLWLFKTLNICWKVCMKSQETCKLIQQFAMVQDKLLLDLLTC